MFFKGCNGILIYKMGEVNFFNSFSVKKKIKGTRKSMKDN